MKPQLHASALGMKCMEQFRRRYVEGEIIPPGVAMIIGIGAHRAAESNLRHKITHGKLLELQAVEETARDGVNEAWNGGVRIEDQYSGRSLTDVRGEAVDAAVRLSRVHYTELAPILEPTAVERQWTLEISGYPVELAGTIDIQEGARAIRDLKTSTKMPPADCAEKSMQLKAYALAVRTIDGKAPERVALDYLINSRSPSMKTFEADIDNQDFGVLLARVEAICLALERGVFPPVEPAHWCCDPKWCGYALSCRYYLSRPRQFRAA